jgi:glucose/arabinose dehydrogenase
LRTERRRFLLSLAAGALLALPLHAGAQNKAAAEVPMLDPWVAPQVVEKARLAPVPATEGEALRAQVRAKLKRRFDAAAAADGTLTATQARSAGLGAIADQFGAIDRTGRGAIRFEDYERFLELRR